MKRRKGCIGTSDLGTAERVQNKEEKKARWIERVENKE